MDNLEISSSSLGPEFHGNSEGTIRISGKSMMENSVDFFLPIHEWIESLINSDVSNIELTMDMEYFNSSSAKQLLKLLMNLDDCEKDVRLIWMYPEGNDILKDRGEELEIMLDLPFEYVAK